MLLPHVHRRDDRAFGPGEQTYRVIAADTLAAWLKKNDWSHEISLTGPPLRWSIDDAEGLEVHFITGPGRFSQQTQVATAQAIARTALALGLSSDSWSVGLSLSDPGVLIEGDSLSAMVGLTVGAMAKGASIPRHRIITGTVTVDGRIGAVGTVALKVAAAHQAGLEMVLVPAMTPDTWKTPALMQVVPVGSVSQAYQALTAPDSPESPRRRAREVVG